MNIVAHQDDDLLFMSPDLLRDVAGGHCVQTVYLTAGDAGDTQSYWLSREQGSRAAYAKMLGESTSWITQTVLLPGGQRAQLSRPKNQNRISLLFLRLPDGGVDGLGYAASRYQSLSKLISNDISHLSTVDSESTYTSKQLTRTLAALLNTYMPTEVRTQSNVSDPVYPDHSDHHSAAYFTRQAYQIHKATRFSSSGLKGLRFYPGYPVQQLEQNVTGQDLADKEAAFLAYAAFDKGVCHTAEECQHSSTYANYLSRQYRSSD